VAKRPENSARRSVSVVEGFDALSDRSLYNTVQR
jgi:hypothetical protein